MPPKPSAKSEPQPNTCPRCGGPMPSPIQVMKLQPNRIPLSVYVCHYCHSQLVPHVSTYQHVQKVKVGT